MISKTVGAIAAFGLAGLVLTGCVDDRGRYSNHGYAGRDDGRNFGYRNRQYQDRGRGSQHDGIGRAANDRVSEEYGGRGSERSGGDRSDHGNNSGSGQSGRGEVFTPPGG